MHTAKQLKASHFGFAIDGTPVSRAEIFPRWEALDRLGIVVQEPFGAIGASYLLQSAITAFYDVSERRRRVPVYPEIYLFHVGGRFGDHAFFDVFPARKEVFVENDPMQVLEAINDRGITRLAVPDRPSAPVKHRFKEPAHALDRIVSAWAYSARGRTTGADVTIRALAPVADANTKMVLHFETSYVERMQARRDAGGGTAPDDEVRLSGPDREQIARTVRDDILARRASLDGPAGRSESYRRISPAESLLMLHAPPLAPTST